MVIIKVNKLKCYGKIYEIKNVCKKFYIRVYFYKGKLVNK